MVEVVLNPELLRGRIRTHFGGQHEDVEEFGAGSGTEGVEPLAQDPLLTGFGPNTPKASCSAIKKIVQKATTDKMSEASNRDRSRAVFSAPLSTQPSKPTRSNSRSTRRATSLAMK
jgi:hypothetical protein